MGKLREWGGGEHPWSTQHWTSVSSGQQDGAGPGAQCRSMHVRAMHGLTTTSLVDQRTCSLHVSVAVVQCYSCRWHHLELYSHGGNMHNHCSGPNGGSRKVFLLRHDLLEMLLKVTHASVRAHSVVLLIIGSKFKMRSSSVVEERERERERERRERERERERQRERESESATKPQVDSRKKTFCPDRTSSVSQI